MRGDGGNYTRKISFVTSFTISKCLKKYYFLSLIPHLQKKVAETYIFLLLLIDLLKGLKEQK